MKKRTMALFFAQVGLIESKLGFKSLANKNLGKKTSKSIKNGKFSQCEILAFWPFRVFLTFFHVQFRIKILGNHFKLSRAVKNTIYYHKNYIFEKKYSWPYVFNEWKPVETPFILVFNEITVAQQENPLWSKNSRCWQLNKCSFTQSYQISPFSLLTPPFWPQRCTPTGWQRSFRG